MIESEHGFDKLYVQLGFKKPNNKTLRNLKSSSGQLYALATWLAQ